MIHIVRHVLMSTLSFFFYIYIYIYIYIYLLVLVSLLVMNSKAVQEYTYFSLLANLEKNKLNKALFTLVRHSSPLPT
jgi:hypothetical protein